MSAFKHLIDGDLSPFTDVISFVDINVNQAIDTFKNWTKSEILIQKVTGGFKDSISLLAPATYPSKYLFIQTESKWTAILKNNLTTSYEAENISRLSGCNLICLECTFNSGQERINDWGGGYLSIFKNGNVSIFDRHLWLHLGERNWEFIQHGSPYEFEDTEMLNSRVIKNKLTPIYIDNICKNFNINFTDENFYNIDKAFIITINREKYENEFELNLKEIRNKFGLNMYDKFGNRTLEYYAADIRFLVYYIRYHSKPDLFPLLMQLTYFRTDDLRLPNIAEIAEINNFLDFLKTQRIENKKTLKQIEKTKVAIEIITKKCTTANII